MDFYGIATHTKIFLAGSLLFKIIISHKYFEMHDVPVFSEICGMTRSPEDRIQKRVDTRRDLFNRSPLLTMESKVAKYCLAGHVEVKAGTKDTETLQSPTIFIYVQVRCLVQFCAWRSSGTTSLVVSLLLIGSSCEPVSTAWLDSARRLLARSWVALHE